MAFIVVITMFLIATPFNVVADCSVAGKTVKDCQWTDWSLNCEQCCRNMDTKLAFKSRKTCCQDILSSEECSAKCGVESLLESVFDDCRVHCEDICKGLGEKPVDESADGYLANSILNPVLSRHLLAADTSQDDLEDCEEENDMTYIIAGSCAGVLLLLLLLAFVIYRAKKSKVKPGVGKVL